MSAPKPREGDVEHQHRFPLQDVHEGRARIKCEDCDVVSEFIITRRAPKREPERDLPDNRGKVDPAKVVTPAPRRVAIVLERLRQAAEETENRHAAQMLDLLKPHIGAGRWLGIPTTWVCPRHKDCGHACGRHDRIGRWYECLGCLYAWAHFASSQASRHGLEGSRSSDHGAPTENVTVIKMPERADVRRAAEGIVDALRLAQEGRWRPSLTALQAAEAELMRDRKFPQRLEGTEKLPPAVLDELWIRKQMRQARGEDYGEAALPRRA